MSEQDGRDRHEDDIEGHILWSVCDFAGNVELIKTHFFWHHIHCTHDEVVNTVDKMFKEGFLKLDEPRGVVIDTILGMTRKELLGVWFDMTEKGWEKWKETDYSIDSTEMTFKQLLSNAKYMIPAFRWRMNVVIDIIDDLIKRGKIVVSYPKDMVIDKLCERDDIEDLFFDVPEINDNRFADDILGDELDKYYKNHVKEGTFDENGVTEEADIHTIAKCGKLPMFKRKLDINRINDLNEEGESLIHCALRGRNFDIVHYLIDNGIEIDIRDSEGYTPIMYISNVMYDDVKNNMRATEWFVGGIEPDDYEPNYVEIANRFLKKGADVNAVAKNGYSLIHNALRAYRKVEYTFERHAYQFLRLIAGRRPDLHKPVTKDGYTAYRRIIESDDPALIDIFRQVYGEEKWD